MNFFKSVFSDDLDPPQTDSESDSESQSHLINEERKNPDPESSPDGSNPKPNPTSNDDGDGDGDGKGEGDGDDNDNDDGAGGGGGGGGGWSFGGFIKTLTTKSETVIETYRRDLQEFGTELKKEIEVAQGSLGNVGNVIDEFGNTVMKGTAQIISQGKDVLLAGDHESDSSDSNSNIKIGTPNSLNSKGYSRFDSQIRVIQGDMNTYLESPEDVEDYSTWKLGFVLEEKSDEMERLIDENGNLGSIYKRLVPTSVDSETFWCRYFYRVHKLQQAEDLRANLVKRAITDEEELSWDVDDDDEEEEEEEDEEPDPSEEEEVTEDDPLYASFVILGRSRDLVDTISTATRLCSPEINRRLPVHFFALFDGHENYHVSRLCRDMMHAFVKEQILRVGIDGSCSNLGLEELWMEAMEKSFEKMNQFAISDVSCESSGEPCSHSLRLGLYESAAVVAVLTLDSIVVANCGGSRAVLCRGGRPIPLSADHELPDELPLITAYGVRFGGLLAMFLTMSDYDEDEDENFKPIVISEPDVTLTKRDSEDECLIIASDGLWNVMTNEVACEIASECLQAAHPTPFFTEGNNSARERCFHAATMLTRLALGKDSTDTISVIVIDLKRPTSN